MNFCSEAHNIHVRLVFIDGRLIPHQEQVTAALKFTKPAFAALAGLCTVVSLRATGLPEAYASMSENSTPPLAEPWVLMPPVLSFSVISDVHCRAGTDDWGYPYRDVEAEQKFANALDDLYAVNRRAAALVVVGDLTNTGLQGDYDSLHQVLRRSFYPRTLLFGIGNHEFYSQFRTSDGKLSKETFPNGVTDGMCIERFLNNTNAYNTNPHNVYYDRWVQGYHFVVLGSEQFQLSPARYTDNAVLSAKQLEWLKEKLLETPVNQPVFVFLHQPIPNTVAGSEHSGNKGTENLERLRTLLSQYPQVILFSGHSHRTFKNQPKTVVQDKFTMVNDSSVRNPAGRLRESPKDSEGLTVDVYDDHVVIKERDFSRHVWLQQYYIKTPKGQQLTIPPIVSLMQKQGAKLF